MPLNYRKLDSKKIVETLEILRQRISERFPGAGLENVCVDLIAIARQTEARADAIAKPDLLIRAIVAAIMASGFWLLGWLVWDYLSNTKASNDLFGTLQGIDSAFNLLVLMGATMYFMVSIEERVKRRRALTALHELRSIIHVIDMHQLTKDPSTDAMVTQRTPSSPKRSLQAFDLVRYLDYCSEMLSLAAKVAVLYAQSFPDPVVTEAVNDLERTSTSLAQKIWQKINILHRTLDQLSPPASVSYQPDVGPVGNAAT